MRQAGLRLGRIFGIEVSADLGVLFIGGLLTWSLATAILPQSAPGLSGGAYWSVAALGALFFLGSLLAHELSHSVVATRNGIQVEGITLWLFGGVAQFKSEARTAGAEFRIAAAGPAMSFILSGVFLGAAYGLTQVGLPDVYAVVLGWLGLINLLLGAFNLLPGAPLDGGRVLAAVIWQIRGDRLRSKIWAARAGRVVALLLVAAGFAEVFLLGSLTGLWTVFIGWFLLSAARMEEAYYGSELALGTLPVSEAMLRDPKTVTSWSTVDQTVNGPFRWTAQTAVPVVDWEGRVVGVVTMSRIKHVPADQWGTTDVSTIMVPVASVSTARSDELLTQVMERLEPGPDGVAVVVDGGRLVGMLTPTEIQRAVTLGRLAAKGRPPVVTSGLPPAGSAAGPPPPPPAAPTQHWDPPAVPR